MIADNPRDLIFVSMEDWDDVWRRNQFVCAEMARRHPDRKILFVGLALDVSNRVRRGRLGDPSQGRTRVAPGFANVTLTRPVKLLPNSFAPWRRLNEAMFRRHVRQEADRLGMREPVLWLNPHYAVHMAGHMGECSVVYDVTDDWTALTQSQRHADLVRAQDDALCRRADATIVCSTRLYEMKRPIARRLHLVQNGVDAAHYRQVSAGEGPVPARAAAWQKPVWGYTGTVHPDRVDVDLIEGVAKRMTSGTIALVGPDMLRDDERDRLVRTGRVVFAGPVPYLELPQWMRVFDVCITPHRVSPFTESLNPIKLWEYLAVGKPIVSTDVAGFRDHPEFVTIATGPDPFLAALAEALSEPLGLSRRRRELARQHSWASRVDAIEQILEDLATRRGSDAEGRVLARDTAPQNS